MDKLLKFLPNLKIFYLILIILVMIVINIILNKRKINSNYKYLINGLSLTLIALITNYFNDIINGIFNYNFLSVKFYIIILIITNIITLITIQKNLNITYKITNYLLFSILSFIFGSILFITIGIKLELLSSFTSQYTIILLNTSTIIFIIYLTIISLIYIIKNLNESPKEEKNYIKKIRHRKLRTIKSNISSGIIILSPEELLSIPNKESFTINGVECGIIFEDSIPENIIKNYHILLNDINAKLVNGYTLEENRLLKSICIKLQINNLNYIDLNNLSILNKISIEEYNFLKHLYED